MFDEYINTAAEEERRDEMNAVRWTE